MNFYAFSNNPLGGKKGKKGKKLLIILVLENNCIFSRLHFFCLASWPQGQHCRQYCILTSCHLVSSSFSWLCTFCSFSWRALLWGWVTASSSHLMSNMLILLKKGEIRISAALFRGLYSFSLLELKPHEGATAESDTCTITKLSKAAVP